MTQTTLNGKRVAMTIFEKAKLLRVFQVPGEPGYVVTSGSNPHKSYRVSEDCSSCNCDAYGLCSHRIAARELKARRVPVTCDYCGGNHNSSTCYL